MTPLAARSSCCRLGLAGLGRPGLHLTIYFQLPSKAGRTSVLGSRVAVLAIRREPRLVTGGRPVARGMCRLAVCMLAIVAITAGRAVRRDKPPTCSLLYKQEEGEREGEQGWSRNGCAEHAIIGAFVPANQQLGVDLPPLQKVQALERVRHVTRFVVLATSSFVVFSGVCRRWLASHKCCWSHLCVPLASAHRPSRPSLDHC